MKTSYILFVGSVMVAIASYVSGNKDINTFYSLFGNVQHFFGLLGVVGSVVGAFFAKSPMPEDRSLLSRATGNGTTKIGSLDIN
jgi:hypothetical protein